MRRTILSGVLGLPPFGFLVTICVRSNETSAVNSRKRKPTLLGLMARTLAGKRGGQLGHCVRH